jgi:hypothetical protein
MRPSIACLALAAAAACGSSATAPTPDAPLRPDAASELPPDARPQDAPAPPDAPPPDAPPIDAPVARLTIVKAASGAGTVTVGELVCAEGCATGSAPFPLGATVTLAARPAPGSYFQGWDGPCTGPRVSCDVTLGADTTVTARFAAIDHNLVFATSTMSPGDFGSLAVADQACADRAAAAGLVGTFKAWLSTTQVNASDRLAGARGWIRLDGLPLFDAVTDITTLHRIWYPVLYDELGTTLTLGDGGVWTGTRPEGGPTDYTCGDWTGSVGATWGDATGGAELWTDTNRSACKEGQPNYFGPFRFYCFMVDKSAPLAAPTPVAGRKIWASKSTFASGAGKARADALCDAEKPAGVAATTALLATTMAAASTLLVPGALYVRPDGVPVGTTEELIAASSGDGTLPSGIWQNGDGTYITNGAGDLDYAYDAFTGAHGGLDAPGTMATTCNDWKDTVGATGSVGFYMRTTSFWNGYPATCDPAQQSVRTFVLCVEK